MQNNTRLAGKCQENELFKGKASVKEGFCHTRQILVHIKLLFYTEAL